MMPLFLCGFFGGYLSIILPKISHFYNKNAKIRAWDGFFFKQNKR